MNINTNYKALLEGRMSKSEFLRQARQGLPQYISNCTSFDDAIKILKHKSILSEELVYQNKADKFPLESIQRGIVYELEEMEVLDVNSPSREEYKKARTRAIDNLCKDPLYYINKIAATTPQPKEDASDQMQKVKVNLKEGKVEEGRGRVKLDKDKNADTYGQIYRQLKAKYPEKKEHELKLLANRVFSNYQKKHGNVIEAGYQPYRGSARGGVEAARAFHQPDEKKKNESIEGDRLFAQFYERLGKPEKALQAVRKVIKDPFWKPSRDLMKNYQLKWLDPVKGTFMDAHPTWKEHKEVMDKMLLKETIINLIGKVINEAATTNLAQLSDENASVAELPAAINNLENIVTEIESFWLKEQQKIQGVFDSLGNIKNEDGLPIGYKFVQPIMASLQKDLQPVLAKINLEGINLPEAPAPDQTPVNDPNNANPVDDPNAVPEVPEKKTVFSPAEEPLQESKKNRRYTK